MFVLVRLYPTWFLGRPNSNLPFHILNSEKNSFELEKKDQNEQVNLKMCFDNLFYVLDEFV